MVMVNFGANWHQFGKKKFIRFKNGILYHQGLILASDEPINF
jgi:hypothetical protein